jgi:signal transduction histidine kinase
MSRPGLRRTLTIAVLAYAVIVAALVAAHGYVVNERAERLVWQSMLESELAHFAERRAADPTYRFVSTDTLKLYGPRAGSAVPAELEELDPGVHDEVRTDNGVFVVLVTRSQEGNEVLALDISDIERRERTLTVAMLLPTVAVAGSLALLTYAGVGWLLRPLSSMANTLAAWPPNRTGQRLTIADSAPHEVEVIAVALNDYLQRIDAFVERERAFVNMASHELRTPIAVISGAAEVALDNRIEPASVDLHLSHILRTAHDMERLIALLVALAKDPSRLRAAAETVDLRVLVPTIARDHAFLAERKELAFEIDTSKAVTIRAPQQIVRDAIGNLMRNAVENSDRGIVRVRVEGARVIIDDPGHGMSSEEMSALYTRIARGHDMPASAGIGLELIARICAHLGWKLSFSSEPGKGTRAALDLTSGSVSSFQQDSDSKPRSMEAAAVVNRTEET